MATLSFPDTIDGKAVKNLAGAHALNGAVVFGQPGGFAVLVKYGANERAVAAQRSKRMRIWRNLNTAAAYVRDELGLARFEIDMTDHDPAALERRRPDTAERQRQLHEAAEHDAWFRGEVQKALDGISDGSNHAISEEDWEIRSKARRAELERRVVKNDR
ncbi:MULTISPECIES: hypothetical protein [Agrobacterium tumefaciens complex]|nr:MULTISPECIES: hypothetical protein [Agrobacterium tumefaciens complex]QCL92705.1 hypothetical protein CFBP6623_26395 [Agrobacterium tumefaciens]